MTLFNRVRRACLRLAAAALLAACAQAPGTPAAASLPSIVFVHGNGDSAALWLTTQWRFEANGWPRERLHAILGGTPNHGVWADAGHRPGSEFTGAGPFLTALNKQGAPGVNTVRPEGRVVLDGKVSGQGLDNDPARGALVNNLPLAGAVLVFSRPRGSFGLPRDRIVFDGQDPAPGVPAGVALSRLNLPAGPQRPVMAFFNDQQIVGRNGPAADNHLVLLELHD